LNAIVAETEASQENNNVVDNNPSSDGTSPMPVIRHTFALKTLKRNDNYQPDGTLTPSNQDPDSPTTLTFMTTNAPTLTLMSPLTTTPPIIPSTSSNSNTISFCDGIVNFVQEESEGKGILKVEIEPLCRKMSALLQQLEPLSNSKEIKEKDEDLILLAKEVVAGLQELID